MIIRHRATEQDKVIEDTAFKAYLWAVCLFLVPARSYIM